MVGTSFEAVGVHLKGPLVLAFSKDDPGAAARVVKDFAKTNDKLVATVVSLGGQVLPGKDLEKVASLPTREQALSMLLGTLKAPIEKFVRTVAAPHTKLVRTVAAVRDAKQAASG
jgi:large subunit ribosomal protein L10